MESIVVFGSSAPSLISFRGALVSEMAERGYRVTALAPNADPKIIAALAERGVAYRHVPLRRTAISPAGDLISLVALCRLFREIRPDVLLAYTIKPVIWGSLAARLAGVPRISSMITGLGFAFGNGGQFRQRLVNRAARELYSRALVVNRRVIFQNRDDLALFLEQGLLREPDRALVVNGSGVDLDEFRPVPHVTEPHFLMAARLIAAKGVRDYVEAGRLLRQRYPRTRLRLAGMVEDNPDAIRHAELATWVAAGNVEHLGWLDDIRPALADCAVYVLPSYREGTPRSVLEAMAMGRPIVTTDAPGCRETVVDGVNGFLVPPRDSVALAAALARFIEEPALIARMGLASRSAAESKYDVRAVNRVILDALEL